jgi:hypothetical protein
MVTGEGGSVNVADIDESRAREAWGFPLRASATDSGFKGRGICESLFVREYCNRRDGADIVDG